MVWMGRHRVVIKSEFRKIWGALSPPRLPTWEETEAGSGIRTRTEVAAAQLKGGRTASPRTACCRGNEGQNEAGRAPSSRKTFFLPISLGKVNLTFNMCSFFLFYRL